MFIIIFIWRDEIHFNKTRYLLFFLNKTNKQMLKRNETIPWYSNPSRPYHHSSSPSIPSNHDLWMEILHFSKPSCWFSPIWLAYSNLEKSWEILTVSKHHRNKKKKNYTMDTYIKRCSWPIPVSFINQKLEKAYLSEERRYEAVWGSVSWVNWVKRSWRTKSGGLTMRIWIVQRIRFLITLDLSL